LESRSETLTSRSPRAIHQTVGHQSPAKSALKALPAACSAAMLRPVALHPGTTRQERDVSSDFQPLTDAELLVVEDDEAMSLAVTAGLTARGYVVRAVATGRDALSACTDRPPDVVLLDLGLPDIDGIDVCRHLRRWTHNPIIVLTADGSEQRMIACLDEGADDYVTKPFSMPQLHARIRVALRHRKALAPIVDGAVINVGTLRVDVGGHVATLDGRDLELRRREFALVTVFARNAGKILTSRYLLGEVWGDSWTENQGTLRNHVATVRRKLTDAPGAPRLVTESGVGYRLLAPDPRSGRTT
jgi:two-component system KDP operon response regulator KdpE